MNEEIDREKRKENRLFISKAHMNVAERKCTTNTIHDINAKAFIENTQTHTHLIYHCTI